MTGRSNNQKKTIKYHHENTPEKLIKTQNQGEITISATNENSTKIQQKPSLQVRSTTDTQRENNDQKVKNLDKAIRKLKYRNSNNLNNPDKANQMEQDETKQYPDSWTTSFPYNDQEKQNTEIIEF